MLILFSRSKLLCHLSALFATHAAKAGQMLIAKHHPLLLPSLQGQELEGQVAAVSKLPADAGCMHHSSGSSSAQVQPAKEVEDAVHMHLYQCLLLQAPQTVMKLLLVQAGLWLQTVSVKPASLSQSAPGRS